MKKLIFNIIVVMGLFNIFSCSNEKVEDKPKILVIPKEEYDQYVLVKTVDTTIVKKYIDELLALEKLAFVPNNQYKTVEEWSIIKIDNRIQSYMYFVIVASLSEANASLGKVIGVGLNTKDKSKCFYTVASGTLYAVTTGKYLPVRLENNKFFKYNTFSDDSLNFEFQEVKDVELKKPLGQFLWDNGFDIKNLPSRDTLLK